MRWTLCILFTLLLCCTHSLSRPVLGGNDLGPEAAGLLRRTNAPVGTKRRRSSVGSLPPAKRPTVSTFITTKRIRGSNYRKKAIEAEGKSSNTNWGKHQADHLLELQAVTHHMNEHQATAQSRPGANMEECIQQVRTKINDPHNLKMAEKATNLNKGRGVTALLHGKEPNFTPSSKAHIKAHETQILNVAGQIDQQLASKVCGKMPPGVLAHAQSMIKAAKSP